jgi:isoleucyl-tRNA synthetase
VNRIQNLRKDCGLEVTDKINIRIRKHSDINRAVENYRNYICSQTLAKSVILVDDLQDIESSEVILDEHITTFLHIDKI